MMVLRNIPNGSATFNCPYCEGKNYVEGKFCVWCGKPIQLDARNARRKHKLKMEGGEDNKK